MKNLLQLIKTLKEEHGCLGCFMVCNTPCCIYVISKLKTFGVLSFWEAFKSALAQQLPEYIASARSKCTAKQHMCLTSGLTLVGAAYQDAGHCHHRNAVRCVCRVHQEPIVNLGMVQLISNIII